MLEPSKSERMKFLMSHSKSEYLEVNRPIKVARFGNVNAPTHTGPSTSSPIQQSATAMNQIITFDAGPSAQDVIAISINITNDDIALEAIESYVVNLEIVGSPTNVVIGRHEVTTVNVLDEDCKFALPVHFVSDDTPFYVCIQL